MEKLFAKAEWTNIARLVADGKNPKAAGDIIQKVIQQLTKIGAQIPSADAMVVKTDAQALAKGGARATA